LPVAIALEALIVALIAVGKLLANGFESLFVGIPSCRVHTLWSAVKSFLESRLAALVVLVSLSVGLVACNRGKNAPPAASTQSTGATQPAAQQMSIDDLVAPIALYPDLLVAQILTAATNPQEVLDGGNWLIENQNLQGDALDAAAKKAGLSPSMQYLVHFPQVLDQMCQQMDWTRQLGQAFQTNQKSVLDAVQGKRAQAQQMGNLSSTPQQTVTTATNNGVQSVQIQPTDPKVVYVPQYNPVTIYNTPAPSASTQTTTAAAQPTSSPEQKSGVSTGTAVVASLLSFGVGMAVGAAISNQNNYYPYPAWGYGGVYYAGRPYYPPPYRPVYTPYYRPAAGYYPPPNYHWSQYNHNVNVNVNNNYYGRFHNTNVNGGLSATAAQPNWKGQSTYMGARPGQPERQGNWPSAGSVQAQATRQAGANRGTLGASPTANNLSATRNTGPSNNYRGNGNAGRVGSPPSPYTNAGARSYSPPATTNRATPAANLNRGDRGYASSPAAPSPQMANRTAGGSSTPQHRTASSGNNNLFSGSSNARADRVASQRGRSSMGAGGGRRAGGPHRQ